MKRTLAGGLIVLIVMVIVLAMMGRLWWCACGHLTVWEGDIHSSHNSQHLLDPYLFTHILHGVLLYGFLWLLLRRRATVPTRFWLALALEALWEVIENSPPVIERFRQSAISQHYYGDTIANSIGDLFACAGGFGIAATLPWWGSVLFFVLTEVVLYLWIRDSLLLVIKALFVPENPK